MIIRHWPCFLRHWIWWTICNFNLIFFIFLEVLNAQFVYLFVARLYRED